jgi:Flp pilus assembly protein TadB
VNGRPHVTPARRELRWWSLIFGALVLFGAAWALVLPGLDGYPLASPRTSALLLGFVVFVGLVLVVALALRRTRWRSFQRSVLWEVDRPDRKVVLRAINRGEPVPDRLRDVAHRTAAQIAGRRAPVWLYGALVLLGVVLAVLDSGWLRWLWVALTVGYLVLAAYLVRHNRRARAYGQRW